MIHLIHGSACVQAPSHVYISHVPVYLWVVLHKPGVSQDDHGSADSHDMEGGLLALVLIVYYQIDCLYDMAGFIGGSIHIVDQDGSG